MAMTAIPKEVLDDLSSRFLLSLPAEEREDPVRICFQAEKAHWFYIDHLTYYANEKSTSPVSLPKCNVREFIRQIFQHCSFLRQHANNVDAIIEKWRDYKCVIPTNGAILLDESLECVLLVQGFNSKASWGFPKGKCNEEELPHHCAIREVKEETGFDITPLIDENDYLERLIVETPNRLYIVPGVPRDYEFKPLTRNEIKDCRWFILDTLPMSRTDSSKSDLGIYPNNFYMVFPYVDQLRKWVANRRGGRRSNNRVQGANSTTPTFSNGDHRHHHQQQQQNYSFYDQRPNRSSPRTRSVSHSSPTFYGGGGSSNEYHRPHPNYGFNNTSDKHQKQSSSAKQQQHQKKNKKTSTCKQKLDFEANGDNNEASTSVSSKFEATPSSKQSTTMTKSKPKTTSTATETATAIPNMVAPPPVQQLNIQPSQVWQKFQFNWEPIFSAL